MLKSFLTYLNRKTHLHVVFSLMAPPIRGPIRKARANVDERILVYVANFSAGTSSGIESSQLQPLGNEHPPRAPTFGLIDLATNGATTHNLWW